MFYNALHHQSSKDCEGNLFGGEEVVVRVSSSLPYASSHPVATLPGSVLPIGIMGDADPAKKKEVSSFERSCNWCGKPDARQMCSRCKIARYCSRECQREGWKTHKKQCSTNCTRCGQPFCASTECRVPHPSCQRQDMGSMFAGGAMTSRYMCGVCGQSWSETLQMGAENAKPEVGDQWCFRGAHTRKPIPKDDLRVVKLDSVDLQVSDKLQYQIDALPRTSAGVKRLTINSAMCYDDSCAFAFGKWPAPLGLAKLKVLHLVDVCFKAVILTNDTCPNVRDLRLQNVPGEAEVRIILPKLQSISIHYYTDFEEGSEMVNAMLGAATRLVSFESYKLQVEGQLRFASNHLKSVSIRRSDCLGAVAVWAPRLEELSLQACYALQDVRLLDDHPMLRVPAGCTPSKGIHVDLVNACASEACQQYLTSHPRVGHVAGLGGDEEDAMHGAGNPMFMMQKMFAQMHRGGGFGEGFGPSF